MKRMGILDASWLAVESAETPMHVGTLHVFSRPDGAPRDYLRTMFHRLRSEFELAEPWCNRLVYPSTLGRIAMPAWEKCANVDLDYHVRHVALPEPGSERELGVLISRLHSRKLDFQRPLWEFYLIEGLENNRFAFYCKMHHSMIDGISGVRLMQRVLADSPDERNMLPPWALRQQRKRRRKPIATLPGTITTSLSTLKLQANNIPHLASAWRRLSQASGQHANQIAAPFNGPFSALNGRISSERRFATQRYELDRIKAVAKAAEASLNDVVLYLCSTALREFLQDQHRLPLESLTAGIPVNIRPPDDQSTGTAISFMIATLATDESNPLRRLQRIRESTHRSKQHLGKLPREAINAYTVMLMSPFIGQALTGMGGRTKPAFNLAISNVPGPAEPLYFEGARLEAMYPISLISHGSALNITCISYNGTMNFGITGCRQTLPSMQKVAVAMGNALDDLEALVLPGTKAGKPAVKRASGS